MSALARYFLDQGAKVFGYDRTRSKLTDKLEEEGIPIIFDDEVNQIPVEVSGAQDNSLIVYTPAVPRELRLLRFFEDEGFEVVKRAQVLGAITKNSINISVAGTHGKTTTSCMLASIFSKSHLRFSAFLGGISTDLGSNYFSKDGDGKPISITEADEFDRSFLHLNPDFAIITSTDADHLDIYGDGEEILKSFIQFAALVKQENHLLANKEKAKIAYGIPYSIKDPTCDYYAEVIDRTPKGSLIDIHSGGITLLSGLEINIPGDHNIENALAAAMIAVKVGVGEDAIRTALSEFKGIKRRFEYVVDSEKHVYIDDYAHHPSELEAIISSVKRLYPNRKLTVVFQPHLYSRTRDFAEGFSKVLSEVDELIMLPIYPARELPIEGIDSKLILDNATNTNKTLLRKSELLDHIANKRPELLLTLGAGDIDRFPDQIKKILS